MNLFKLLFSALLLASFSNGIQLSWFWVWIFWELIDGFKNLFILLFSNDFQLLWVWIFRVLVDGFMNLTILFIALLFVSISNFLNHQHFFLKLLWERFKKTSINFLFLLVVRLILLFNVWNGLFKRWHSWFGSFCSFYCNICRLLLNSLWQRSLTFKRLSL